LKRIELPTRIELQKRTHEKHYIVFAWQKNYKAKVGKAFFFIFMSSCPEVSFWAQKEKKSQNRVKKFK
jgi:hypothetical protein